MNNNYKRAVFGGISDCEVLKLEKELTEEKEKVVLLKKQLNKERGKNSSKTLTSKEMTTQYNPWLV